MSIVFLIEPFYTGSHKSWSDGIKNHSKHSIELFSLPGRHWKWRMHGAAVHFAQLLEQENTQPDLLLVSDMLDVATFKGLSRKLRDVPTILYFHENQLSYPWSPQDQDVVLKRDRHYGWINFTSALAADEVWFNSHYHLNSFLSSLSSFLKAFPDQQHVESVELIKEKSKVQYLGMAFPDVSEEEPLMKKTVPRILWNHRWEFDKNPREFLEVMVQLEEQDVDFQLVLLGEEFPDSKKEFAATLEKLKPRIVHKGFVPDKSIYARLVSSCDLLPVTSIQDFFGISIMEAAWYGVPLLLPERLTYRELFQDATFYKGPLTPEVILNTLEQWNNQRYPSETLHHFSWEKIIQEYDDAFDRLVG